MKWILRGALLLVALVVLALGATYFYLDAIARNAVERGGTYATGVDVTVDNVKLGLLSGEAGLTGLTIDNPQGLGFQSEHFLHLGRADVAVDSGSLFSDSVVVPRLHLDGISLNLEQQGDKKNFEVILENLEKLSSGEKPDTAEDAQPQQWTIQDLRITDVKVNASVRGVLAENQNVAITIPEIVLTDVRSDSLAELQGTLIKQLLSTVLAQAGRQLPGILVGELTAGLGRVGDLGEATLSKVGEITGGLGQAVGGKLEEVVPGKAGEVVGQATRGVGEAAGKVTEGLGGLLGGKKKEEEPRPDAE